jgi:rhodanese-related sulfurtransferase
VQASTIAEERLANLAFRSPNEDAFVETLLNTLLAVPRYYGRMARVNRMGAPAPDLAPPPPLDGSQVLEMVNSDAWVVDLRGRGAFASGHLAGTINFEHDVPFATYLGWLLPDRAPLVLLAESQKTIGLAQVDLSRIGIDEVTGQFVGDLPPTSPGATVRSYPVRGFPDLTEVAMEPHHVALDVRRSDEWEVGHLDAAIHVPLHELEDRMGDLPPGTLWVHCAAGYRAAIAASLLERRGREVVLVDGRFATP